MKNSDWNTLKKYHHSKLLDFVRKTIDSGQTLELIPNEIALEASCSEQEVITLINYLEIFGLVKKQIVFVCPNPECGQRMDPGSASGGSCYACGIVFAEYGEQPTKEYLFHVKAELARNVDWVITVHGMNTRGSWQEELAWGIANTYPFSIPVAVYKYGIIVSGVFLGWRQRQLVDQFATKLKALSRDMDKTRYSEPPLPDVIAHSFGTWLLGHILMDKKYQDLNFGRVILTGCILRPDFDWQSLILQGRVKSVLNHYGRKDNWAFIAHYFIPKSGPSGRIGFSKDGAINVPEKNFSHSSFFETKNIRQFLKSDGLWHRFLTKPVTKLNNLIEHDNEVVKWKETPFLFRELLRFGLLVILILITLSFAIILVLGTLTLWDLIKIFY